MYDDLDYLSGYHAPIEMIVRDMETQIEDNCVKAVQQYGFIVDKEELKKVLEYDRDQYEAGYEDGYRQGVINGRPMIGEWIEITEESIRNLKDHYYYLVAHKDYGTPMKAKYHCDYPQFEIMSVHDKSFGVCLLEEPCPITHYMELPRLPWERGEEE